MLSQRALKSAHLCRKPRVRMNANLGAELCSLLSLDPPSPLRHRRTENVHTGWIEVQRRLTALLVSSGRSLLFCTRAFLVALCFSLPVCYLSHFLSSILRALFHAFSPLPPSHTLSYLARYTSHSAHPFQFAILAFCLSCHSVCFRYFSLEFPTFQCNFPFCHGELCSLYNR